MAIDPETQEELLRIEKKVDDLARQMIPFQTTSPQPVDQVTNSVTAGGTNGTIADYSDLSTYSNDASAIRNNLHQLARSLKQVTDALRKWGLGR